MEETLINTMVFLFHIMCVSLGLAIFTSVFVRSKAKGIVCLILLILLSGRSIVLSFDYSAVLGSSMVVINIGFGVLTYFVTKRKLADATITN